MTLIDGHHDHDHHHDPDDEDDDKDNNDHDVARRHHDSWHEAHWKIASRMICLALKKFGKSEMKNRN